MYLKNGEPVKPNWLKSVGRPYRGVDIRIVDPEGNELPQGESGEILIKSSTVMAGYYKRPEQTADVIKDGWYHTGDVGYFDEEGLLYISDRIKDMIITGGENVYSAEVESALLTHPDIAECAVIGIPSDKWGEDVMACVVPRPGATLTAEAVIAYSRERIAHFKCPKHVKFVEAIPRNALGKILKHVLREPYWVGKERKV